MKGWFNGDQFPSSLENLVQKVELKHRRAHDVTEGGGAGRSGAQSVEHLGQPHDQRREAKKWGALQHQYQQGAAEQFAAKQRRRLIPASAQQWFVFAVPRRLGLVRRNWFHLCNNCTIICYFF